MGKENLKRWIIRYNGLFDFNGLYQLMTDWCKNYGYIWREKFYKHKVPSHQGAEQEISWICEKDVTEWIHYTIDIYFHIWDLKEIEISSDSKNKPLSSGRIEITIRPVLSWDWQEKFKGGKFTEWMGKAYAKLYQKELESVYYDTLHYRALNLQNLIKKFLDMQAKKHEYKGYLEEN
jgi:hypothetical protein